MKNIIKVLRYVIPYWGFSLLNIIFNILATAFSVVSLAAVIPILRILENFNYLIGSYIARYDELTVLAMICGVLLIMFFLKNLFRYLAMYYIAEVRNGVVRDMRNALYTKILILPLSYYSEKRKGDIISRMTGDVQAGCAILKRSTLLNGPTKISGKPTIYTIGLWFGYTVKGIWLPH